MAEAVKWGERGARINSISPGIIVTPLAIDEFNGPVSYTHLKYIMTMHVYRLLPHSGMYGQHTQ